MKKTLRLFFPVFICVILFSLQHSFAQDTIFKKNKEQIRSKVLEIGLTEIKYKMYNNPDGPLIVIRKDEVFKIKYENGTETIITPDPYSVNQELQILNKTHAIKTEFLLPLAGAIAFGYEQMIKVGTNVEAKIGIIGPGFNSDRKPASGAFIKAGIKFLTGQDYVIDGMRYAHPLKGRYIKLEAIYTHFTYDNQSFYSTLYPPTVINADIVYNAYAFNIVFGKQAILGNIVTLDTYFGFGFGTSSMTAKNNTIPAYDIQSESGYYSHLYLGKSFPMILSGGISLGIVF